MLQLKDLLIQFAIIIIPVFLYEMFWLSRYHNTSPKQNRILVGLLTFFNIFICLLYPIHISESMAITFSILLIYSSILYGGRLIGTIIILTKAVFVYLLYGLASLKSFPFEVISCILPFIVSPHWVSFSKRKKFALSILMPILFSFSMVCLLYYEATVNGIKEYQSDQTIFLACIFFTVLTITMLFHVYLREFLFENAEIRVQMQKSEKLNMVSELAASVAHEVRNPLTVVRGFIQLIENQESGTNREYMKLVLAELDRAENIISDYLNLARPQIEEKKIINMTEQLNEVTTLMSSYASLQGAFLQVNVNEEMYTVGDRAKLKQAIINVLKNGVEAIKDTKGYIKIEANIEKVRDREYIRIVVKDNGVGMSKAQLDRLGQPFYSLKEKGTGLGLMVTFSIIEAHKGTIEYLSEEGKGTEVHIVLPAYHQEQSEEE
ncbi:sporulation kinase [Bacillus sp. AFS001701]|uniref:sensor histidine kinase n=1 Tax=Bacillaceae TaxID=186817 RepID=UPI000BF80F55|nr:HAMP domain-containing sensor histidine kinase [Bacillus sp. AFS001701]PET44389.1 sporulation kinase [Bacillus sp. AFS001701]